MGEQALLDSCPVTQLKGVGNKVAEKLARLGILSISDLLFHLPFRYEDRSRLVPIGALKPGESSLFEGKVELSEVVFRGRRSMIVRLSDGTGFITLRFFHFSKQQKEGMQRGQWLRCFGDIRGAGQQAELTVMHPSYTHITEQQRGQVDEGLLAVYPVTDGLNQGSLRKFIKQAYHLVEQGQNIRECLPASLIARHHWPSLGISLKQSMKS